MVNNYVELLLRQGKTQTLACSFILPHLFCRSAFMVPFSHPRLLVRSTMHSLISGLKCGGARTIACYAA